MNREDFPVFCGNILKVGPVVEGIDNTVFTLLQYLPGLDQVTSKDVMAALLPNLPPPEDYVPLDQRVKKAVIPLRLEAAVFEGSDVRARFSRLTGEDGRERNCYEIEVIRGPITGGFLSSERFKGYKHIKILE